MKPIALILAAASSLAVVTTTPALAGHGGISQKEMVNKFVRIFDRLDHNNNGKLSRKALRRLETRGRGHNNGPNVRVVFGDENFRIAFGTGGGGHRGGSSYLGPINTRTFHLYDLNRNGVITRRELRHAVRDEFRRADRNDDGYLSRKELNRSNWYRTSLSRSHGRYYPDYRRLDVRVGHGGHRGNGHKADRRRDGHRDGHKADQRRDGHRDGHKADRQRNGHRDGHKANKTRDGHRDGSHDANRNRDGHHDADRSRDGHKANRQRDGHKDKKHRAKRRENRNDRDRDRDDDKRRHDRDEP